MITAGIDEAGRGPVLGPLVMAVCSIDERNTHKLVELGVKDSKLLMKAVREDLFEKIKELCEWEIIIVPPTEVDEAVNSKKDNLNLLEARVAAQLLVKLKKKTVIDKAILDSPTKNTKKFEQTMQGLLPEEMNLVCENKADLNYPIVAAASILAKVTRDREMERVSELADADLGSGYMTDPKTHAWLQENYNASYGFIRRSWASVKNLISARAQTSLSQFETKKEEYKEILEKFEKLLDFGFKHIETKTPYELVRMRGPENADGVIIYYTTGKLLVQGKDVNVKKINAYLQTAGLL